MKGMGRCDIIFEPSVELKTVGFVMSPNWKSVKIDAVTERI